jgi:hypothetical protein
MDAFLGLLNEPAQALPGGARGRDQGQRLDRSHDRQGSGWQGYRVGLYTSPHLQEFTERLQVNGRDRPRALVELVDDRMRPLIDQVEKITWFEITTGLAFEHFADQNVDVAVIEVGLGGAWMPPMWSSRWCR